MRPFKFRAWDKETEEMWTDVLTEMGENDQYDDEESMWSIGYMMEKGDNERFEFMQFTGVIDKNGKEIYEGDILKTTVPEGEIITYVVFEQFGWCEKLIKSPLRHLREYFPFGENKQWSHVEVIGNVYQHVGLLNQ